jgi:hypothetical protein
MDLDVLSTAAPARRSRASQFVARCFRLAA